VCGRAKAVDNKNIMLGFWAHLLNDVANERRIELANQGKFIFCSGYLFAIRKEIAQKIIIPEDVLDDAYISIAVWNMDYKIAYAPSAAVLIRNPSTLKDWILQKRRNASGHKRLNSIAGEAQMKSFSGESSGILKVLRYPIGLRQTLYTFMLIPMRLWIWILAFWDSKTKKTSKELWKRVESTK
jgi:cellulose synthase/poly-beta-1,6-N-acetylglucosamine synthase-like glycosyltransferase